MRKTPTKPSSFGLFVPKAATADPTAHLERAAFSGLAPAEAARRLADFTQSRKGVRDVTHTQKRRVLQGLLQDLAERRIDLANVTPEVMSEYREYLRQRITDGEITESTASHFVRQWNAAMRLAFGEKGKPGESLVMKGFRMFPRKCNRFDEEDFAALRSAAMRRPFRREDDKDAFDTFLELVWCTGARVGSLATEELTLDCIDWEAGVLRLRHMKNRESHDAVLTDRVIARLRRREAFLKTRRYYRGRETPILASASGRPITGQALNSILKECAAMAGISKPITNHVLRKSVGTLIGKENPRFAVEQLGITQEVFEHHYNQPTLEDRLDRRDILPGASRTSTTPEEAVGRAAMDLARGRISREEFEWEMARAEKMRALPAVRVPETSAYQ